LNVKARDVSQGALAEAANEVFLDGIGVAGVGRSAPASDGQGFEAVFVEPGHGGARIGPGLP